MTPRKNSLFVDTAGWAELADRRQPLHLSMQHIYQRALQRGRIIVITNYILSELVPLLCERLHMPRATALGYIKAVKTAPFTEDFHITPELDTAAWNLLKARTDKAWSLVDASSFVVMQQFGMTEALTTDHHFTQAGFMRVPTTQA